MQLRVDTDALHGVAAKIRTLAGDAEDVAGLASRALATAAGAAGDSGVEAAAFELMSVATTAHELAARLVRALGAMAVAGADDYARVEQEVARAAGRP